MLQALLERRKDDRGFTLIELMIVILIIGILISVGLPTFLGARERAQDRATQAQLRNGMAAAKVFYTDANTYTGFSGTAVAPATVSTAVQIEPSIPWIAAQGYAVVTDPALSVAIKVSTATGKEGLAVVLSSKSAAGDFFCLLDVAGSSTGLNGTFYQRTDTTGCAGDWYQTTDGWLKTKPAGATKVTPAVVP